MKNIVFRGIIGLAAAFLLADSARAGKSILLEREELAQRIKSELVAKWRDAWLAKDARAFAGLFAEQARSAGWTAPGELTRERDGIREHRWETPAPQATTPRQLERDAARYLAKFDRIEALEFRLIELRPLVGARDADWVKLEFDLRGFGRDGRRRTDRARLSLRVDSPGGLPRVRELAVESGETLTAAKPAFREDAAAAGLAMPRALRKEAIRRGGYALAVGDYDGDGAADIYVGSWEAGRLFRNDGRGSYEDVSARAGLRGDTRVKAALMADMDNDGRRDLVLQRFLDEPGGELVFYRNQGDGTFAPQEAKLERGALKHDRAMSMAAADFDNDGKLDLYMGYPGVFDFTDPHVAEGEGISYQAIFMNKGAWAFAELQTESEPRFYTEIVRPHSALAKDVNGDGKADILVVDDRGYLSKLYVNEGNGRFSAQEARLGLHNQGWGMMVVSGDYNGDGMEDLYFSNIDFTAGRRFARLVDTHYAETNDDDMIVINRMSRTLQGNRLYRGMPGGSYQEVTEKAGVGFAGEAPAGAEWFDYNNDGLLDLYVANGLWSADPARDHTDEFIRNELAGNPPPAGEPNSVMKRLQRTGESFAGYQRNRLFRNNGDGTFTEVGFVTGADRVEDGYVVAFADPDADGDLDLVLRNADPPSDAHAFPALSLLRNEGPAARSLTVRLAPKEGVDAFNARLTATVGDKVLVREIRSVVGAVQSEQLAHFGLGEAKRIDSLQVRWPSGRVDTYFQLEPGRVTIHEGSSTVDYLTYRR